MVSRYSIKYLIDFPFKIIIYCCLIDTGHVSEGLGNYYVLSVTQIVQTGSIDVLYTPMIIFFQNEIF
jgi:hypothetical protein